MLLLLLLPLAGAAPHELPVGVQWDRPRGLPVVPEVPFIEQALPEHLAGPVTRYVEALTFNDTDDVRDLIEAFVQSLPEISVGDVCVSFSPSQGTTGIPYDVMHFSQDLTHGIVSVGVFGLGPADGFSASGRFIDEPGAFKSSTESEVTSGFWSITVDGLGSGCS